ncbi:cation diffusion facilitator family transporter [Celeribacter indicus]|uniref:Ferrous-iron efflux pump FieF n=1 Tax=Celeribacter indicus TaxID=1208324 RepID=A0A0B5DZS4_9RHOB|nr:cation diffusion facilitator family transporter [Celeribacter indicus]AJE48534.1 ferrous-iron efflux pump FieF [Celeribacter indicus]SDX07924.1 ferrous-iron efflux pump FieF [Celeribacter indicus]
MTETRLNLSAGLASVSVAMVLVIAKLWALGATGSLSIAASLADSGVDLMVSLGGLLAIFYASRPPDEDHAFGHTSAEDLAALGQSIFILVSAGIIAVTSARRLLSDTPVRVESELGGIAVMGVSIVLTVCLVLWQRRVARRTGSKVVSADSLHYLGDLIPNIGAIVALFASRAFGLAQIDSVVALGAAAIMAFGALRIWKSAWDALMDRSAPAEMVQDIERMATEYPGVHAYHDLKTRMAGSKPFVNIHIEVDGDQTLREAHAISAGLKRQILDSYPTADVIVHKDVAGEAD